MPSLALSLLFASLASAPTLIDHFPDEGAPTHVFLLVDASNAQVIRSEGGDALRASHPWGDLRGLVVAAAGLEARQVDPLRTVPCDSTCWARGGHGDVALVAGLASGCERWFAATLTEPDPATLARVANAMGLGRSEDGERATAEDCVHFWRMLSSLSTTLRSDTSTELLAVAGTAVSSPRGSARALHDPRRRTRAFVAGGAEGAWVIGGRTVAGREWAFALYLPGGTPAHAAARALSLLESTRRVARKSTQNRGGQPSDEDVD